MRFSLLRFYAETLFARSRRALGLLQLQTRYKSQNGKSSRGSHSGCDFRRESSPGQHPKSVSGCDAAAGNWNSELVSTLEKQFSYGFLSGESITVINNFKFHKLPNVSLVSKQEQRIGRRAGARSKERLVNRQLAGQHTVSRKNRPERPRIALRGASGFG